MFSSSTIKNMKQLRVWSIFKIEYSPEKFISKTEYISESFQLPTGCKNMAVPTNYGVLSECSFCADRASMQLVRMGVVY